MGIASFYRKYSEVSFYGYIGGFCFEKLMLRPNPVGGIVPTWWTILGFWGQKYENKAISAIPFYEKLNVYSEFWVQFFKWQFCIFGIKILKS